ncbi:MAG: hypothetical protein V8Q42_12095 [Anaerovoracaceae bacterium]
MRKKTVCFIMAACMILTLIPSVSFAAADRRAQRDRQIVQQDEACVIGHIRERTPQSRIDASKESRKSQTAQGKRRRIRKSFRIQSHSRCSTDKKAAVRNTDHCRWLSTQQYPEI